MKVLMHSFNSRWFSCLPFIYAFVFLLSSTPARGGIFTSDSLCSGVNLNHYENKRDVFLDGGPQSSGGSGDLDIGNYWVRITAPNGNILGYSEYPAFVVAYDPVLDGNYAADCYRLWNICVQEATDQNGDAIIIPGYKTTSNNGNEYQVEIAKETDPEFNQIYRSDNYKVDFHLDVYKTANSSFDREYKWKIEKDISKMPEWHLFIGDIGTSQFNVKVGPDLDDTLYGFINSNFMIYGNIFIWNDIPNKNVDIADIQDILTKEGLEINSIISIVDQDGNNINSQLPYTLNSGQQLNLSYIANIPNDDIPAPLPDQDFLDSGITIFNEVTIITQDEVDQGDTNKFNGIRGDHDERKAIFSEDDDIIKEINKSVDVIDEAADKNWLVEYDRENIKYPLLDEYFDITINTCDIDPASFADLSTDLSFENTAKIVQTGMEASVTVDLHCYKIGVSKTAPVTEFTRFIDWSIEKSVYPKEWNLFIGDTGTSQYNIAVTEDVTDFDFNVSGVITIENPNPEIAAQIVSVADQLNGNDPETLKNDFKVLNLFPATLPYNLSTQSSDYQINRAIVEIQNYEYDSDGNIVSSLGSEKYVAEEPLDFSSAQMILDSDSEPSEITMIDNELGLNFEISSSGHDDTHTFTPTKTFSDPNQSSFINTAFINETDDEASATVTLNWYGLNVSKTAVPFFTRTWDWTLEKTAIPSLWNLFKGDTANSLYTIDLERIETPVDSGWRIDGMITIDNPNAVLPAQIVIVKDMLSSDDFANDLLDVDPNCDWGGNPNLISAESSILCDYSQRLDDGSARKNKVVVTLQNHAYNPDGSAVPSGTTEFPFITDLISFDVPTTKVNETVDLIDNLGTPDNPSDDIAQEDIEADHDPIEYSSILLSCDLVGPDNSGTITNTATITGNIDNKDNTVNPTPLTLSDTADIDIVCHDLIVEKSADPFFTRTWDWTIDKTASPDEWNLFKGDKATSQYLVKLDNLGFEDSRWRVDGDIKITNPNPQFAAVINQYEDVLSDADDQKFNASVNCNGLTSIPSFDESNPDNNEYICSYSSDGLLFEESDNEVKTFTGLLDNLATITITNHHYNYDLTNEPNGAFTSFTDVFEDIDFVDPTTKVNETVTLMDDMAGLGDSKTIPDIDEDSSHPYDSYDLSCDLLEEGSSSTIITNTAKIVGSIDNEDPKENPVPLEKSDSADVNIICYELLVEKTAVPFFTRTWDWNIEKTAYPELWNLFYGDIANSLYEVDLTRLDPVDSRWRVDGEISITNPNPQFDADVDSWYDTLTDNNDNAFRARVECYGLSNIPAYDPSSPDANKAKCDYSSDAILFSNVDNSLKTFSEPLRNTAGVIINNYHYKYDGSKSLLGPLTTFLGSYPEDITFETPTTSVNETVELSDDMVTLDPSMTTIDESKTVSYDSIDFSCELINEGNSTTITNTAKIVGNIENTDPKETPTPLSKENSADVTITCHALNVEKTAETYIEREYSWQLEKTAISEPLDADGQPASMDGDGIYHVMPGQPYTVDYQVEATNSYLDDFGVMGKITIDNPNPEFEAVLKQIVDEISDFTGNAKIDVTPDVKTIPASSDQVYTYLDLDEFSWLNDARDGKFIKLPDGDPRTNTATASLINHHRYYEAGNIVSVPIMDDSVEKTTDFSDSILFNFVNPVVLDEFDKYIQVTDVLDKVVGDVVNNQYPITTPLGVASETGDILSYSHDFLFTNPEECFDQVMKNIAKFETIIPNDDGSDPNYENLFITDLTGESNPVQIKFYVECLIGCTLTQGYWKTHSGYGPAPYDENWLNLFNYYCSIHDEDEYCLNDPNDPGIDPSILGPDVQFFGLMEEIENPVTFYEILWTPPKGGNAYYILAHQYIAAKLNDLRISLLRQNDNFESTLPTDDLHDYPYDLTYGGEMTDGKISVMDALLEAEALFHTLLPEDLEKQESEILLGKSGKNKVKTVQSEWSDPFKKLAGILGEYNEGVHYEEPGYEWYPPHCDEDPTSAPNDDYLYE